MYKPTKEYYIPSKKNIAMYTKPPSKKKMEMFCNFSLWGGGGVRI